MSDWLEQLKGKLLTGTEEDFHVEEILQTEIAKVNGLFAQHPLLNECTFSFLSTNVSTIEGLGNTLCYARAEITGVADNVHIFIAQDYLKRFCEQKLGPESAEDPELLRAFLKFFLLEMLVHLQSHPAFVGQIASLAECHIGVEPQDLKDFQPAQSVDVACNTSSLRIPIRIICSTAFYDSWKAIWKKNASSNKQQRAALESKPVTLCLHAAFTEISDQETESLSEGDWIVLEKVGFDSPGKETSVMILAEGVRIGIGLFDGKDLLIKELAPSSLHDKLRHDIAPY